MQVIPAIVTCHLLRFFEFFKKRAVEYALFLCGYLDTAGYKTGKLTCSSPVSPKIPTKGG